MKKLFLTTVCVIVLVSIISVTFADDEKIQQLLQLNKQIDSKVSELQNQISQLVLYKSENIGRIKQLQELAQEQLNQTNSTNIIN